MPRAKKGFKARRRRNKVLALAKGNRQTRHNCYKLAATVVRRGLANAYRDRRAKKRAFRRLWIVRINAASRANGLRYSEFIAGLTKAGIRLDRSVLANLAIQDQGAFSDLCTRARAALV